MRRKLRNGIRRLLATLWTTALQKYIFNPPYRLRSFKLNLVVVQALDTAAVDAQQMGVGGSIGAMSSDPFESPNVIAEFHFSQQPRFGKISERAEDRRLLKATFH